MLKDTTSQHRAHLFDLNCKICTGIYSPDFVRSKRMVMLRVLFPYLFFSKLFHKIVIKSFYIGQISASEDEVPTKKIKSTAPAKKAESKSKPEVQPKYESSAPSPPAEPAKETVPENAMETEVAPAAETVSQTTVEGTYIPTTQGHNNTDSSVPEEPPAFPASCSAGVVTTVTVSGRDPRTAMSGSLGVVTPALRSGPAADKVSTGETKQETPKPVMTIPKSILTKPSSSPDARYLAVHQSPNIKCVYLIVSQAAESLMFYLNMSRSPPYNQKACSTLKFR